MSKYLVIVESPTKARTILAIVGKDYELVSSMGHIVDLPSQKLSVDIEGGFIPDYKVIPGKEKVLSQLKKKAQGKEAVYLATDPDREGEAISWHIKENLAGDSKTFYRIVFHEITAEAIREAFTRPSDIDMNKVHAQIARRVLDRIVGYYLSPLLWKRIVRGLSAGRVQSVALKFIVEREREIEKFKSRTTYSIEAKFKIGENEFEAKLCKYKGKKAEFDTKEKAQECRQQIINDLFAVKEVARKELRRRPSPPYITSLLQQDAFNKLRYSSQKTMLLAQKLYEGVKVKEASVGLITYMRTDSFRIAPKAKKQVKEFIRQRFGEEYLPKKEHHFKERKSAQGAHEAIRPTNVHGVPEDLKEDLSPEEARLYDLIWRRFTASFMKEAVFENTKVLIASPRGEFVAEGRRIIFDGYLKVYGRQGEESLPALREKDKLTLLDCKVVEHTTKPPPRFNDASLVKLLEEKGIGRPSTYAPTIFTLIKRNYIRRGRSNFYPTELGIKVSDFLVEHFSEIMEEHFTALMEENLDKIEEGKISWKQIIESFYPSFKKKVDETGSLIKKEVEFSGKTCPKCKSPLVIKWSRRGKFLSCFSFPKCRYAESITSGVACPECKEGELIERRNKRGQFFYGCTKFPLCRYTARKLPEK